MKNFFNFINSFPYEIEEEFLGESEKISWKEFYKLFQKEKDIYDVDIITEEFESFHSGWDGIREILISPSRNNDGPVYHIRRPDHEDSRSFLRTVLQKLGY